MEKISVWRSVRRLCAVFLAIWLVLLLCTPVQADETGLAEPNAANAVEETEEAESSAAIEAQLAAVARAKGQDIAEQMLFESFRALSPTASVAETEATAEPAKGADGEPSVVVHAQQKVSWSFSGLLPFLLVLGAAAVMLAVFSVRRTQRSTPTRAYRPMYDRTFQERTFEKYSVMRLD